MCTAVTYNTRDHYFGRNLDMEFSYDEEVTVMPRNFSLRFRNGVLLENHPALIGTAYVVDGYPLYYDAVNEYGVAMAALNFPEYAYYGNWKSDSDVAAPFEFIPWVLCQCRNMTEVRNLLSKTVIADVEFNEKLPVTPLHWIISAKSSGGMECITVEPTRAGLKIYENPVGVLTNAPEFNYHMINLTNYMSLSSQPPANNLTHSLSLMPYSRGMGGVGLPGDLSSTSRFVRAAFVKLNSMPEDLSKEITASPKEAAVPEKDCDAKCKISHIPQDEDKHLESVSVSQFFHILSAVEQQRGCVRLGEWENEITVYSSCCNTDKGIYYYRTYDNSRIYGIDMHLENLEQYELIRFPMIKGESPTIQNKQHL